MSGTMNISFEADMPVAAVEVVSPDFQTIERVAMRPGTQRKVQVPSEASFIRVHLQSGKIVTVRHPGDLNYALSRADLSSEGKVKRTRSMPAGPKFRDIPLQLPTAAKALGTGGEVVIPGGLSELQRAPSLGGFLYMEPKLPVGLLQTGEDRTFTFVPREGNEPHAMHFETPTSSLHILLPGNSSSVTVRIRNPEAVEATTRAGSSRTIVWRLATSNETADTVASYLARGDYYAAETMAPWAQEAESLLADKVADPYAATVGAYLLLRLERYDLMHDWVGNLANWFGFLSDGSIIWAWQNIRERRNFDVALQYLLKAAAGPLPLHTEGLRLLSEGLRMAGEPAARALAELTERVGTVYWSSPLLVRIREKSGAEAIPTRYDIGYASGP